jgi:hypothetical protein
LRSARKASPARTSRVSERVLAIADFFCGFSFHLSINIPGKFVSASRRNPHAGCVRYPDEELIRVIRDWKLLFRCGQLGEFLEARIVPKRIEHGIEPEQRGSERYILSQRAVVRYRE